MNHEPTIFYDKERSREQIAASPLFTMEKAAAGTAEYSREARRLVGLVYEYLMAEGMDSFGNRYAEYGVEMMELISWCIGHYRPEDGALTAFVGSLWNRRYRQLLAKSRGEEALHGLHLTAEDKRCLSVIRNYLLLAEKSGSPLTREQLLQQAAAILEITPEKARLYAETAFSPMLNTEELRLREAEISSEASAVSGMADMPDLSPLTGLSTSLTLPEEGIPKQELIPLLEAIESEYLLLQDRQKPLISEAVTAKLLTTLYQEYGDILTKQIQRDAALLARFTFPDMSLIHEFAAYPGMTLPTQRMLAQKYDRAESGVSRSVTAFSEKVFARMHRSTSGANK